MKRRMIVYSIVTWCWALGALGMSADLTVGTWKLNAAKSKYAPAEQARYETIKIEAVGDSIKVTLAGTDSAGKKVQAEWTGKYDGKDYPVTGSPDIDALAYKKANDHNYQSTTKKGGKTTGSAKIVYSADGKTRTVTSSGTNAKGQKISATAVYEKQ
jgi:hypothetical protein